MNNRQVGNALNAAQRQINHRRTEQLRAGVDIPVHIGECEIADACYAFIVEIQKHGGFLVGIACRWIKGRISAWKRGEGC